MSQADGHQSSTTADKVVAQLQTIDERVNAMRIQVSKDPDSLGDKLLKFAIPSLTGLLVGKLFKMVWDRTIAKTSTGDIDNDNNDQEEGFIASAIFAGLSAALTAVVSQLSDKGSQALVDRRHARK